MEFKRALAHGTFNGAMRLAQGGKFHHGFLSGFVSSLGGSFLIKNGGDMTGIGKITISATIGGTAEALGGGKFANGAVTGAYVMAFNHLMHSVSESKSSPASNLAIEVFSRQELVTYLYENSPLNDVEMGGVELVLKDGSVRYFVMPWNKNTDTSAEFDFTVFPRELLTENLDYGIKYHTHLSENMPSYDDMYNNASLRSEKMQRSFVITRSSVYEVTRFKGVIPNRGTPTGVYKSPVSGWLKGNFIGF